MKKFTISLAFVMMGLVVMSQSVPREMVVTEVGTGTWCTYCPGAAMGVDDLLENGKFVAVIENHNGDSYANAYSNARNTFYGISAYPSMGMDGKQGYVGGNHTTSLYPTYLSMYNQRIVDTSPVTLSMEVTNNGLDYTAVITITKVDAITASNIILHFVVTQSNIMQNWQGQTHLEHVTRLMVPSQTGTPVSFASGDVQVVTLNFTLSSAIPLEDVEFVTFLQNTDSGQGNQQGTSSPYIIKKYAIFQGIKRGAIDLTPGFTVPSNVVNKGETVTFTNTTHGGYIGVPEIYEWHFPGATPDTSSAQNPSVVYNECGPHDVTLIVWRGGQMDTLTEQAYIQVGPNVIVNATPNDTACWYQTITLDATTPGATTYLWQPGGMTTPSVDVTYAQYGIGLHNFTVTVNANGCELTKEVSAYLDVCSGFGEKIREVSVAAYPNPNNGDFTVELSAPGAIVADLTICNSLGMTVRSITNLALNENENRTLTISGLQPGVYFMTLHNKEINKVQKIVVK